MRLAIGTMGSFKEDVVMVTCLKTIVCSLKISCLGFYSDDEAAIFIKEFTYSFSSLVFIYLVDTDTPNLAVDCECRSIGSQSKRIKKHDIHHLSWGASEWSDISRRWDEVLEGHMIANTMWPLAFWTVGMCGEQDGLHSYFSDTRYSQRRVDC